ncbi:MAG: DUF5652 family protein [Minisyncoccia bacterium]
MFDLWLDSSGWLILLLVWSLPWKGVALWKSARSSQKNWFIALLILNTAGILEILYIFVFSKNKRTGLPRANKKETPAIKEV